MSRYDREGIHIISSGKPGPRVAIMAATHGDEPAGLSAHKYLLEFFNIHPLKKGEILLIVGNPKAQEVGKICLEENLNRLFTVSSDTENTHISYERTRAEELKPLLKSLDYLLDIHSTNNPGPVFGIIKNETPLHWDLAESLPVEFTSFGWGNTITGTTCDWIDANGGVGITVECGDHNNPDGGNVAIRISQAFLQKIGLAYFEEMPTKCMRRFQILTHETVQDRSSFEYTKKYDNFDALIAHELIALDTIKKYHAPNTSGLAIVFPTKIESIRSGAIKEAYLLGKFYYNRESPP